MHSGLEESVDHLSLSQLEYIALENTWCQQNESLSAVVISCFGGLEMAATILQFNTNGFVSVYKFLGIISVLPLFEGD